MNGHHDNPLTWQVFADTCVVNRIVDFGEFFFDDYLAGETLSNYEKRPPEDRDDIDALHDILRVYHRMCMPLYVTEAVLNEVAASHRPDLLSYAREIFHHWQTWGDLAIWKRALSRGFDDHADKIASTLRVIRGSNDRLLVAQALVMGCDVFLTVDRRSLWNRRAHESLSGISILRPRELWDAIRPWARLVL